MNAPDTLVRSLEAHFYTDPAVFRAERAGLLCRTWQFAGHGANAVEKIDSTSPAHRNGPRSIRGRGVKVEYDVKVTELGTYRVSDSSQAVVMYTDGRTYPPLDLPNPLLKLFPRHGMDHEIHLGSKTL